MTASAETLRAGPVMVPTRRVSVALIAYGLSGILIAVLLFVALGPLDLGGLGAIESERNGVMNLLASSEAIATDGSTAVESAGGSVTAAADAVDQSAAFTRELAGSMRQLGDALQVDVLGAHPFESAGTRVEQAADRADTAADKLDEAASEARSGAASLSSVAGHLDDAATSLAQIRSELEAIQNGSLRWLRFALIALGIWLFVPAAVALWLGVRLWRGSAAG